MPLPTTVCVWYPTTAEARMATRNAAFRRLPDAAFVPRKADGAARAKESESAAKSQLNPRALRLVSLCGQCCSRHNEVHIAADEDNRTCRCSFGVLLVVSATANDAQSPIRRLTADQSVLLVNPAREKPCSSFLRASGLPIPSLSHGLNPLSVRAPSPVRFSRLLRMPLGGGGLTRNRTGQLKARTESDDLGLRA